MKRIKSIIAWFKVDKKRFLILLVIIGIIFFVSRRGQTAKPTYQTAKTEKGTIVSSVTSSGQILSTSLININTQATGVVNSVYVKNGDKVYVGQVVAKVSLDSDGALKNTQAWASVVSASNAVNAANNNYRATQASLQNIYDQLKGHDSDETFAQKDTRTKSEVANDNAYDQTKTASVNLASANMSYRLSSPLIVAPITGIVDNITITPGMILSGSSASSTTVASNRVAVVRTKGNPMALFNLSEVDVNRVLAGQKATITLDSISGKTFAGRVLTVDKIGTVTSGVTNYPVIISFDTQTPEILPNMAATANIIITTKDNVLLVPSSAVQTQADQSYARVLKGDVVENMPVEVGLSSDTQTEIVSGLNEGDEVITGIVSSTSRSGSNSPFSTFRLGGNSGGGLRVGGAGR